MVLLQVQEFSLTTAVEYRRPVLLADANLVNAARGLFSSACADYLNPTDLSFSKGNELFSYTFSAPMFGGAASIVVNAQGITVSFKQGKTTQHLGLMVKLTLAALETLKVSEIKRSQISFTAHAAFQPASEYAKYMAKFTGLAKDIASGGTILVAQMPDVGGELRYASEKSLAYPDALFLAVNTACSVDVTADLLNTLASRFEATAALEGLAFTKPPPAN